MDDVLKEFLKDFKQGSLKTKGWPAQLSAYAVSKVALNAYTRIIAASYPAFRINCVCPGFVNTDINCNTGFLTPEEGAEGPVSLALLPDGSPSGRFFQGTKEATFWSRMLHFQMREWRNLKSIVCVWDSSIEIANERFWYIGVYLNSSCLEWGVWFEICHNVYAFLKILQDYAQMTNLRYLLHEYASSSFCPNQAFWLRILSFILIQVSEKFQKLFLFLFFGRNHLLFLEKKLYDDTYL